MATCLISLGSNQGDRAAMLRSALEFLNAQPEIELVDVSQWYVSQAVGGPAQQNEFLNGAAILRVSQDPFGVLQTLQRVETKLGRHRKVRWGPRVIDLDLLLYEDQIIRTDQLTVPHPRMGYRRFVVQPAAQIAPNMIHPQIGWNLARLQHHLSCAKPYVALAGATPPARHQLAAEVAARMSLRWIQLSPGAGADAYFASAGQGTAVVSTPQARLEFRQHCAAAISDSLAKQPAAVTLSDYWLAELHIQLGLPGDKSELQSDQQPKLLVALWNPATATDARERVEQLVQTYHHGPCLLLPCDERAADELTAAIEAMQADVTQLT